MREANAWVIVGLGNPGRRYHFNRHNIGFIAVDALQSSAHLGAWRSMSRFSGDVAKGKTGGITLVLAKPTTYMNLSGQCVVPLMRFYRVPAKQLIVIHDDVDLALGRLKIKRGGGDAGHNGLRSITGLLGSGDYARVRVGVGRPEFGEVADYVLANFSKAEQPEIDGVSERAGEAALTIALSGVKEAMNQFNTRHVGREEL